MSLSLNSMSASPEGHLFQLRIVFPFRIAFRCWNNQTFDLARVIHRNATLRTTFSKLKYANSYGKLVSLLLDLSLAKTNNILITSA